MVTVIFCPKCKSHDVTEERVTPLPPRMVSMDDLGNTGSYAMPAVLRTSTWRATCNDCGYFVEYQSYDG